MRFELLAVGAVVDPLARGHDPFARGNGSRMAHHCYDVTVSARSRAQDAETILSVDGRLLARRDVPALPRHPAADSCGSFAHD